MVMESGEGFVLEIGVLEWSRRTSPHTLDFSSYGKLRSLGGKSPLWLAECHFPQQPLPAVSASQPDAKAPGGTLKKNLVELAEECASGLAASLLRGESRP